MKRLMIAALAGGAFASGALAADLPAKKGPIAPPPVSADGFDFAFGAKIMSDYVSRGITQSDWKPSATAYFEGRYNIGDTQFYAAVQPWTVKLPTNPAAEVDLSLGVRQTWGKFTVDVGGIYYWYPDNKRQFWTSGVPGTPGGFTFLNPVGFNAATCAGPGFCATTAKDPSFLELYIKPSYNVTDLFNIGANFYWSPNWNNYNFQSGYISATAKYTFGESGFSVSGELGRMLLGSLKAGTIFNAGPAKFKYPDYTTWNVGVSYAWKNLTADLRYHGSDMNKTKCYINTSDPSGNAVGFGYTGRSNWCGHRIMASIALDFVYSKDFKK